jgi:acetyl-CoA carboxylase biotin carboxylase subunit
MRLRRCLDEFVIGGIETTIPLHKKILAQPDFINGEYDNRWLEKMLAK